MTREIKATKVTQVRTAAVRDIFTERPNAPRTVLNNSRVNISVYQKINKGGLISSYMNNITLKKGHIYNVCLSGSLEVGSNEFNNSGNYSIQMTDGYDNDLCRELTRIKRDGAKIPYTNDNIPLISTECMMRQIKTLHCSCGLKIRHTILISVASEVLLQ